MTPMKGKLAGAVGGLALAVSLIGGWEGLRTTAYRDIIGVPTVCYGETRGVKMGDKYTKAECDAMLEKAIVQFETGLDRCMVPPTVLPVKTKVAFVSWSYNVGVGAACRSTLVKLVNDGKYDAACDQLPRWNRSGGKVVQGLTNRRNQERGLCLSGLSERKKPVPRPASPSPNNQATLPQGRKC